MPQGASKFVFLISYSCDRMQEDEMRRDVRCLIGSNRLYICIRQTSMKGIISDAQDNIKTDLRDIG
jgi:hypothetical protein